MTDQTIEQAVRWAITALRAGDSAEFVAVVLECRVGAA